MPFSDDYWMQHALHLARQGAEAGEVPVGAVLVLDDQVIGEGSNNPITACDPTAHAEILALRAAAQQQQNYRLVGSTLYVTIEPCTMCVGALVHARVGRVVFGAREPRAGAICSAFALLDGTAAASYNHRVVWTGGVLEEECAALLTTFFRARRNPPAQ